MSRSLQSSIEYFGGSNRWSRNDRDMVPWKSSIGLISSKISSRPEEVGTSSRPSFWACSTRARHFSLPSSVSKLSVWRARRFGTSSGSRIFANEMRRGAVLLVPFLAGVWGGLLAVREAAKRGPSEGCRTLCVRACRTARGKLPGVRSDGSAKRQHTLWARRPQVALRRPCGRRAGHWNCHGASRMTPLGLPVKHLCRIGGWNRGGSEGDDLAHQPAAVHPVHGQPDPVQVDLRGVQ